MATPLPIPRSQLMTIAVVEGVVITVAAMQVTLGGGDLNVPLHLGWFIGTTMLAGSSLSLFVVRSLALNRKEQAGESVEDDRKAALTMSMAMLAGALAIAAIGPVLLAKWLGP